jgi:hydrogenase maturation protease
MTAGRGVLVCAIGNGLRRDDGVAHAVADGVEAALPESADCTIIRLIQLLPELAEPVSRAALLIVVDAALDLPPGEVAVRPIGRESAETPTLTHHVSPAMLPAYSQTLYGHAPPGWLVTVGGADFGFGEGLSPPAQAAVGAAVAQVLALIGTV